MAIERDPRAFIETFYRERGAPWYPTWSPETCTEKIHVVLKANPTTLLMCSAAYLSLYKNGAHRKLSQQAFAQWLHRAKTALELGGEDCTVLVEMCEWCAYETLNALGVFSVSGELPSVAGVIQTIIDRLIEEFEEQTGHNFNRLALIDARFVRDHMWGEEKKNSAARGDDPENG